MGNLIRRRRSPAALRRETDTEDWFSPRGLRREIEQLFDEFFSPASSSSELGLSEFNPSIEMMEKDGELVMRAELPGLTDEDVSIEVDDDNILTVRGVKLREEASDEGGYQYSELNYGQFVRAVQLPSNVDSAKIEARFDNGVLELHIPKTAEVHTRAIPIAKREKAQTQTVEQPQVAQREGEDEPQPEREVTPSAPANDGAQAQQQQQVDHH